MSIRSMCPPLAPRMPFSSCASGKQLASGRAWARRPPRSRMPDGTERQGAPIPRSRKGDPTIIPDNPNWHRFKMACPFYRERWIGDGETLEGRPVLYHVICLQNTPPATIEEQQCCLESKTVCGVSRSKTAPARLSFLLEPRSSRAEQRVSH